ncbi:CSC1-like protein At1g69450 isoform X2 [Citrus clementina]|uniref:CSC1-like protein At1g69450 isoform X2 n=1 Tax=Citrus clementina TaxID=85681 RepID=UPI000CED3B79|nr:CSC1-like protein At1g69450 isoform X2 [Citrus x clementina]
MLVSALLTSVGINSGLCVLFFTLYSILRKQPSNYEVYVPRLLAKGSSNRRRRFNLEMLIPSAGWVSRAWKHSEEDLLESSGLDAVVFMRVITFSLKVFLFAGIIGIFVILPVNAGGTEIYEIDFADLPNNSLDVFTISNVNRGSHRLWVHFGAVYLVTIFVCYLLYSEYKYICVKRMDYFYSSKPQPHQFTVLVRSIPVSAGSTIGDTVENFFKEFHPTTYLSHTVIHQTSNLCRLMDYAKKLYGRLIHLQSDSNQEKNQQRKVDLVDHYGKRLENIEENSRLERSEVSMARHELQAAFVSFKSRYGAAIAFHMQQSTNPTDWLLEQAPEPNDVYWPFFSASFMRRWISKIVVVVACILLTILFLIPVLVVQGLTNLNQLEIWFPFLKSILTIKFVSQVVTGYLPNLILLVFLKIVPPVMEFLSSIQGYISHSDIQKSACNKVLWFMIWNIFFATVFSGSVLYQLNIVLDPKNIPARLGVAVPAQASFFIAYVVTSGWTGISSELFQIFPLICSLISKPFTKSKDDDFEVPAIHYHSELPRILLFGLLGITYFFLAPLILPFLLIYLCLAYIIYRNQLINVYEPKYETAGKFWPIVHNSMIFSLVLMHAIAVGIFTIKKLSTASTLIFPLPVLTLLFNEYCRKRFLPNFIAYPAEVLIKKDREDRDDATIAEFFDSLAIAYRHPALLTVHHSGTGDSLNRPLLSSPEI